MPLGILVVEPDRHARDGLRAVLAAAGHNVSVAGSVFDGVRALMTTTFDVLLLDVDDPGGSQEPITAADLLRFARTGQPAARWILLTAAPDGLPDSPVRHGALAILEKPLEVSKLWRALEAAHTPGPSHTRSG